MRTAEVVVWGALCACACATRVVLLNFLTNALVPTHLVLADVHAPWALF